jgi:hypothetical protein
MSNRSNINLVGNTTTGQNLGNGDACIYLGKSNGNNLQFRSISATGGSIQIYQVGNRILIGGGGGTGGTSYNFYPSGGTIIKQVGSNITIYSPTGGTGTGTITGGTNGLGVSGKNICLGGTLIANTTIGNGTCALSIKANQLNLTGVTGVYVSGTTHLKTTPAVGTCSDVALTWDSGTTAIRKLPIITEWVSSISELAYTGQKFSYPTQSVFQTDVGVCSIIPNYIFISGICLSTVCTTLIFTIPSNKNILFNRAKLIMLCTAIPTGFAVSIGNNYCGLGVQCSYNNLATCQTICDVCANETYELCLFCGTCRQCAVRYNDGSTIYFNTVSGSTCSLSANLLIEGFLF